MTGNRSLLLPLLAGLAATVVVLLAFGGHYLFGQSGKTEPDTLSYPPSILRTSLKPPDNPAMEKPPGFLPPESVSVPILVYHNIAPHRPTESKMQQIFTVSPQMFDRQLRFLADSGYHPILPQLMRDVLDGTAQLPDKPVMLTFDDGWRTQYENAYPLLEEFGFKAVFYVFTNPMLHDNNRYLSWDMLSEMESHGMAVGSHSVTHPYLKKSSDEELTRELTQSRRSLEQNLGHQVYDFAYPFGQVDGRISAAVAQAGYLTARTLVHRTVATKKSLLELGGYIVTENFADFTGIFEVKK